MDSSARVSSTTRPAWQILCRRSSRWWTQVKARARTVYFHISNYEEVGHGASAGIPADVAELVTVDMAVVGAGRSRMSFSATIVHQGRRRCLS